MRWRRVLKNSDVGVGVWLNVEWLDIKVKMKFVFFTRQMHLKKGGKSRRKRREKGCYVYYLDFSAFSPFSAMFGRRPDRIG